MEATYEMLRERIKELKTLPLKSQPFMLILSQDEYNEFKEHIWNNQKIYIRDTGETVIHKTKGE